MAQNGDEEAKKDAKPTYLIEIRDNGANGGPDYPLEIRVKPTTQIFKVLTAWCNKFGLVMDDWRFKFEGDPIVIKDDSNLPTKMTISDMGIEEDVVIDAFRYQLGGSR